MGENKDEKNLLIHEYKILVDLIKHQHTRIQDFDKTFLTVNTILIGTCAFLLKEYNLKLALCLFPLCVLGIATTLIWICSHQRMNIDSDLRWFQLRDIEMGLSRPNGIFIGGNRYFFQEKILNPSYGNEDPLVFPTKGIRGIIAKFRVIWIGILLPLLFMALYFALMLIYIILSFIKALQ